MATIDILGSDSIILRLKRIMESTMQKELEQYALKHYEEGGHWVVECFGRGDYDRFIVVGDLEQSKRALKEYWELIEGYAEDIRSA